MKRLSALFLIACGAFAQTPPPPKKAAAPATTPAAPAAPARDPGLYMIMNTSMGTMTAKLFEKEAPGTVKNFVDLARGNKMFKDAKGTMVKRPYFSNLLFHRVIPNFMIQTGDQTGTGSGDCGFTIKDEIVPSLAYNKPGMLGLGRLAAPNRAACSSSSRKCRTPRLPGSTRFLESWWKGRISWGRSRACRATQMISRARRCG